MLKRRTRTLGLLAAAVMSSFLVTASSASAWTLNSIQLDNGTCRQNLQIGSDHTASSSATPSFLLFGDGGASRYSVSIDGAPIGTFTSDPYANVCIYTTLPLANGQHSLTATELFPTPTNVVVPFNFSVDTIPPSQPATPTLASFSDSGLKGDGITQFRSFTVQGTADPSTGILIGVNGTVIGGTSSNTSGVWSVGTSVSADGTYPVSADAVDTAGNASPYSSALSVTVDTVPPTGLITNPTAGSFVSGTVPISAVGSDNLPGLWKVTIQVDGVVKSTLTTSPYVYNWPSSLVANGSHTLGATIYDVAGNSYTTTIPITVQNGGTTTALGAPTLTSATAGNGSVALTWNAPASNGGATLTGYAATASPSGATCTASGTGTGCTVGGLTNGTSYSFTVTATNSVGTGPASNALSAIPSGTPGAPTLSTATRSVGSVTLGWSAPTSDGGSPITNYTVTASPGGATCNSSGLSCTVGGLAAGTS